MSKIKELKEKQARVWEQQKAITDAAHAEGKRNLTTDEETKWNGFDSEFETIQKQIEIEAKTQAREAQMSKPVGGAKEGEGISKREAIAELILKNGKVSDEVREVLYAGMSKEMRAQTTQTPATGGYLIPTDLANEIVKSLSDYGGIRGIARVITTSGGNDLDYPTSSEAGTAGAWIGENTQVDPATSTFGTKQIKSYKATSNVFQIPRELIEDSVFDINAFIREAAAERIGRTENAAYVNGDGSNKPTGFVRDAAIGLNSASKTAITTDELMDLLHSVNPAYRKLGCDWVFNDTTFKMIRKLKDDNDGLYIWQMGDIKTNAPSTLLGHTYTVEQDMPSFGAGLKPIAFGHFKKFIIRDVAGMRMMNLIERYADYDQIGVIAFHRTDCKLVDTAAVKVMRNPVT